MCHGARSVTVVVGEGGRRRDPDSLGKVRDRRREKSLGMVTRGAHAGQSYRVHPRPRRPSGATHAVRGERVGERAGVAGVAWPPVGIAHGCAQLGARKPHEVAL